MSALEDVLDKDFFSRSLTEQKHTFEELITEIKLQYPNLKGCSLRSIDFIKEIKCVLRAFIAW